MRNGHSGSRPAPMLCTGPVKYIGQKALATDIENLKTALKGKSVVDVFMPAVSPGQVVRYHVNQHYKSADESPAAVGEALREEYKAIIDADFMLQIDDPHLAMHYMLSSPNMSIEECGAWCEPLCRDVEPRACATCREIASAITPATASTWARARTTSSSSTWSTSCSTSAPTITRSRPPIRATSTSGRFGPNTKLPRRQGDHPGRDHALAWCWSSIPSWSPSASRICAAVGRENVLAGADCGFASMPRAVAEVHPSHCLGEVRVASRRRAAGDGSICGGDHSDEASQVSVSHLPPLWQRCPRAAEQRTVGGRGDAAGSAALSTLLSAPIGLRIRPATWLFLHSWKSMAGVSRTPSPNWPSRLFRRSFAPNESAKGRSLMSRRRDLASSPLSCFHGGELEDLFVAPCAPRQRHRQTASRILPKP